MGGPDADGRLRIFVAVELPEPVRAAVGSRVEPLRRRWPELRWVAPERLHLTLRFLGEVAATEVSVIARALEPVAAGSGPFALWLGGLGGFPSAGRTSVLWVGADGGPALVELAIAVEGALAPRFGEAEQAFRPHVTLARARRAVRLDLGVPFEPVGFEVQGFVVMRSVLGPSVGPRYEVVRSLPFSG